MSYVSQRSLRRATAGRWDYKVGRSLSGAQTSKRRTKTQTVAEAGPAIRFRRVVTTGYVWIHRTLKGSFSGDLELDLMSTRSLAVTICKRTRYSRGNCGCLYRFQ